MSTPTSPSAFSGPTSPSAFSSGPTSPAGNQPSAGNMQQGFGGGSWSNLSDKPPGGKFRSQSSSSGGFASSRLRTSSASSGGYFSRGGYTGGYTISPSVGIGSNLLHTQSASMQDLALRLRTSNLSRTPSGSFTNLTGTPSSSYSNLSRTSSVSNLSRTPSGSMQDINDPSHTRYFTSLSLKQKNIRKAASIISHLKEASSSSDVRMAALPKMNEYTEYLDRGMYFKGNRAYKMYEYNFLSKRQKVRIGRRQSVSIKIIS